ncbi:DUF2723 domain-containing protein [Patescibacteria group bacterium]|nr:DUF2723 domain-containing protein [Patescibacteria group bacterium]
MVPKRILLSALAVSGIFLALFLLYQARGIYGGDSGDLVTAAFLGGVPHPPGYPLYSFLGFLLSHLPVFTVSWRVALLSSVPHAMTAGILMLLLWQFTRSRYAALFAGLLLTGNYLFFLYSVTPEVFALLDWFLAAIIFCLFLWVRKRDVRLLYLAAWLFGLSLTNQQIILFAVPAFGYWVWAHRRLLKKHRSAVPAAGICAVSGLFPYVWSAVAGRGSAIINWDRPGTVAGLFRLMMRADYGTFQSGGYYGAHLIDRLLQLKAYAELALTDFTVVGAVLILAGVLWLFRTDRRKGIFFTLLLLSAGPVFFFYASFPLFNRFNLGTYERFLLPSYLVLSLLAGTGVHALVSGMDRVLGKSRRFRVSIGKPGLFLVLLLYPLALFGITLWRFQGMAADRTAEYVGRDILSSVPKNSIVLLGGDTPLFITQYVRYAERVRPDTAVLHIGMMTLPYYPKLIHENFPDLRIPTKSGNDFLHAFIEENRAGYPIFINRTTPLPKGWYWVPYGLLYRLMPESSVPSVDQFRDMNTSVWSAYHNPRAGILGHYTHLMLSDILDGYAGAREVSAQVYLKAGKFSWAIEEARKGLAYGDEINRPDLWTTIGLAGLFSDRCHEALSAFSSAEQLAPLPDKQLVYYEALTYRDCLKDAGRATVLFDRYRAMEKQEETPLR